MMATVCITFFMFIQTLLNPYLMTYNFQQFKNLILDKNIYQVNQHKIIYNTDYLLQF